VNWAKMESWRVGLVAPPATLRGFITVTAR
jgi:hypothetical protein